MFDHVTIRVTDRAESERLYRTVLATIGREPTHASAALVEWDDFSLLAAEDARRITRNLHIGFAAPSRADVDRFWRAGVGAGFRDDGAPGPRPVYGETYYGGFLLDPDGNSAEAAHHRTIRTSGVVDHLWIGVADLAASRAFYELVAEHAGYRLRHDSAARAGFSTGDGSFSLLPRTPTANMHLAFPAPDRATVDRFHAGVTGAGYRDNGPPGERPRYHPGYYGAFVLDPDGNNIELVHHDRG